MARSMPVVLSLCLALCARADQACDADSFDDSCSLVQGGLRTHSLTDSALANAVVESLAHTVEALDSATWELQKNIIDKGAASKQDVQKSMAQWLFKQAAQKAMGEFSKKALGGEAAKHDVEAATAGHDMVQAQGQAKNQAVLSLGDFIAKTAKAAAMAQVEKAKAAAIERAEKEKAAALERAAAAEKAKAAARERAEQAKAAAFEHVAAMAKQAKAAAVEHAATKVSEEASKKAQDNIDAVLTTVREKIDQQVDSLIQKTSKKLQLDENLHTKRTVEALVDSALAIWQNLRGEQNDGTRHESIMRLMDELNVQNQPSALHHRVTHDVDRYLRGEMEGLTNYVYMGVKQLTYNSVKKAGNM